MNDTLFNYLLDEYIAEESSVVKEVQYQIENIPPKEVAKLLINHFKDQLSTGDFAKLLTSKKAGSLSKEYILYWVLGSWPGIVIGKILRDPTFHAEIVSGVPIVIKTNGRTGKLFAIYLPFAVSSNGIGAKVKSFSVKKIAKILMNDPEFKSRTAETKKTESRAADESFIDLYEDLLIKDDFEF